LFSCATALLAIGPDTTFETTVHRRGEVVDGTLKGDLILVAGGDLTLGGRAGPNGKLLFQDNDHIYANYTSGEAKPTPTNPLAGLENLAKQIQAAGIKRVTGEVLVDDRLFARSFGSGSGPGVVTPVVVNDNLIDVLITPGSAAGQPATVKLIPETEVLRADVDVTTGPADGKVTLTLDGSTPYHLTVRGTVPADGKTRLRIHPIDDPTAWARGLFIEALRRAGVRVTAAVHRAGSVELPPRDALGPKVATYTSEPFREVIRVTLKVSHNLYASTLPCLTAVAAKSDARTAVAGLREQGKRLAELGLPVTTFSFGGGAGGHWADCVTPKATVQLLQAMRKRPEWEAYREALPVLGVDGTLADVVPTTSPARGKVFAKTGTLTYDDNQNGRSLLRSKALAGVTTTANGTDLAFAIFVNNVPPAARSRRQPGRQSPRETR
jgi:serine-type D-Ala-D-Ala carboxypeptidase/endopeptidase (penicillin-binding protein 4)